ncbi:hypothetical protein ETB97_012933 [Aspergillus alliaceus]|uniref:BZIP domain-containing protein n=1 Tax=Petromyces alliaceus TaxID=209559 RepID=A0A5N7CHW9_PETAA|nr:hypothetical protein BDV23DRAFT_150097 [Aspergillus alliaceus]KAF5861454.1 hypothetical protein ETB97_012933 [Aspergillus burnettii]
MDASTGSSMNLRPRETTDTEYDTDIGVLQWDETMQHHHQHNREANYHPQAMLTDDIRFIPTLSVTGNTPSLLHSLPISAHSNLSPPAATACITMNPIDSAVVCSVGADSQHLDHNGYRSSNGVNRRQSQNREAQRRFRERREQERVQTQVKMDVLRTENKRLSDLFHLLRTENNRLEGENERLKNEVEILRKRWKDVLRVMSEMAQQDGRTADHRITSPAASCSSSSSPSGSCSQIDVQSLRRSVVMQTLVALFEERGAESTHSVCLKDRSESP